MTDNFFYENIHKASEQKPYIDLQMTNLNYFSHFHNEIELIYVLNGTVSQHTNSRSYAINKGEIAVIMPGEVHSYTSEGVNRCYIIKFYPVTKVDGADFSHLRFMEHVVTPFHSYYATARQLMENVAKEFTNKNCGFELAINCDLSNLILLFLRNIPFASVSSEENKKQSKQLELLYKVDSYVTQNYAGHISLEDIARHTGYSTYYFSHFFKETAGQNFSDYLILFRLERALNAINHSEKNLTDIAFDCGFNSIRSFNRAFQNYLKITPSEYRRTRILQENL